MSYHSHPGGGEPWGICCKSCRLPIFPDQESEDIRFPAAADCEDMSGTYHIQCAKPFSSIARAMNMLSRFPF